MTASAWLRPMISEDSKEALALAPGEGGAGDRAFGQAGEGVVVAEAQSRSQDAELHRQLAQALWCRSEGDRSGMAAVGTGDVTAPAGNESKMEAILFHPETSVRRALILALGCSNSPTSRRRSRRAGREAPGCFPHRSRRRNSRRGGMDVTAMEAGWKAERVR